MRTAAGFAIALFVALSTFGYGASLQDMFAADVGDPQNPSDNLALVVHQFVDESLQPWAVFLYVDEQFNAIDPLFNPSNRVDAWMIIEALQFAVEAWNDLGVCSFEFGDAIPFDHSFSRFPSQTITPGATGLDGWNLITFQDPAFTATSGVTGLTLTWKFWRAMELSSFLALPSGVLVGSPPPTQPGVSPAPLLIDFDRDGYADIMLEARDYAAGEIIESDIWMNQIAPWRHWPQDPADLPTTLGGQVLYEDTLGTLDVQGTAVQQLGYAMGLGPSPLLRASLHPLLYARTARYPTDVWDRRTLDLDDEVAAALAYVDHDGGRGAIGGRALDGRNFDGVRDQGVIDPLLYATIFVTQQMTTGTLPALVADKVLITTVTGATQQDLDTSAVFWVEVLATVQTGNDISIAAWPNPLSLINSGINVGGFPAHIEASAEYLIPALPPFDRYILYMTPSAIVTLGGGGTTSTVGATGPVAFFQNYQPVPVEFYGGNLNLFDRRLLGADAPTTMDIVTSIPLVLKGDDPTSYVFVAVQAGAITQGIDLYSNTGGLPAGVTPTPIPGARPTPAPIGSTSFTPDIYGDAFVPTGTEWSVACAVGDVDNDGDIDVYVCNAVSGETSGSAVSMVNRLLINTLVTRQPDGSLVRDRTNARLIDMTFGEDGRVGTPDDRLPFDIDLSFGAEMADFNLDGYIDIYVSNSQSISQGMFTGAENRLYLNRGGANPSQAGYFDDVTAAPRTDPGIGIPIGDWYMGTGYTATIMPGILNAGVFTYGDLSTKSDTGDIDSDGDIDIVVANFGWVGSYLTFGYWYGPYLRTGVARIRSTDPDVPYTDTVITLAYSERILINHANDYDPLTRGFYFTDETLGMDGLVEPPGYFYYYAPADFGEYTANPIASNLRICADRLPPVYPLMKDVDPDAQWGEVQDDSLTYEVILAPMIGDGSLDLLVVNRNPPRWTGLGGKTGTDMLYENADIDGDGIADGYFRLVNFGWDFMDLQGSDAIGTTYPLPLNTFEYPSYFGFGGLSIADGDREDQSDPEENNTLGPDGSDSLGGAVFDMNYHGWPQMLTVNGTAGNILLDLRTAPPGIREVEAERAETGSVGGYGLVYYYEFTGWPVRSPSGQWEYLRSSPLSMAANFARDMAVADFDNDGDEDVYVAYSADRDEDISGGVPVNNEYFVNNGFGAFTNATLTATSGTARGTYYAAPFDFDLDSDVDIFLCNAVGQNTLLFNMLYLDPPDLLREEDNPMFYDATPKYFPPFFLVSTYPPFTYPYLSNLTVNTVTGDLNGDGLPEVVEANGALYTAQGDSTMLFINHGAPHTEGTTVFTPIGATYPGPRLLGPIDIGYSYYGLLPSYYLNTGVPAFDVVLMDADLDGDYDIVESTLGMGGVRAYANMDSYELLTYPHGSIPDLQWMNRILNSIADDDFLGDALFIPADTPESFVVGFTSPIRLPRLTDPGGFTPSQQKKWQGRRLTYADVDSNGAIDIILATGIPIAGAPNVLLLNGVGGSPAGHFVDATETHLPTVTHRYTSGTQIITYRAGIDDDTVDVAAADFDNDSFVELIFLNQATGITSSSRYLDNTGNGHFFDVQTPGSPDASSVIPSFPGRLPNTLAVADFDRKGDPTEDINGNGVLDPGEDKNDNGVLDWWDTTESEDINGNGILDPGEDGLEPFWPPNGVLDSADLNGDGQITPRQPGVFDASWDLFITFGDGPDKLYLNTMPAAPGTAFALVEVTATNLPLLNYTSYGCDVGDVDLDGDIDIAVAVANQPTLPHVLLYLNDGVGRFRLATNEIPSNYSVLLTPTVPDYFHNIAHDVDLFDVDGDGDLDMHVSYLGFFRTAGTGGGLNAIYINRTVGDNFNTINRFQRYRAPFLVKLSPTSAYQGNVLPVTVFGQNLDSPVRGLDFGPGILCSTIARTNANAYSVMLRIAEDAALGPRDVVAYMDGGRTTTLGGAFTVLPRATQARPTWNRYR